MCCRSKSEQKSKRKTIWNNCCLESKQSWRELLQQPKRHGLTVAPKLAVGNGSLGFWLAIQLALQEKYGPVPNNVDQTTVQKKCC
jgi:hypothetical protein